MDSLQTDRNFKFAALGSTQSGAPAMPRAFVFDAYGTLFDVHAAIGRHRAAAGSDADRLSEVWRTKQLEYTWTLTLAGRYEDFWTLTERALDFALARFPAVDRALKPQLMDAYRRLDAFADAGSTLRARKARGRGRCRPARHRSRCGAVGRRSPHVQAAPRGLSPRDRAFRRRARR